MHNLRPNLLPPTKHQLQHSDWIPSDQITTDLIPIGESQVTECQLGIKMTESEQIIKTEN